MKIKHVVTSGCSFSEKFCDFTWPHCLAEYTQSIDPNVTFTHMGMGHQGQELIQKKATYAIMDALEQGIDPKEIAVIVMWSGNDRKTWYVDNPQFINNIVRHWTKPTTFSHSWDVQFCDLKNSLEGIKTIQYGDNNHARYNPKGGWFHSGALHDELDFMGQYYWFSTTNAAAIHLALENMIMLQTICKSYGISFYQQYYMKQTWLDLEQYKHHHIVSHLYRILDEDSKIFPSINEYAISQNLQTLYSDPHPTPEAHAHYTKNVLVPFLQERQFFD